PGVVAVLTRDDLMDNPAISPVYGPQIKDQPIVALDRVRYVGDAVAAVAAEDPATAAEALLYIDVEYEELPAVFDAVEAAQPDAPKVHELTEDWLGTAAYFGMRPIAGTNICHHYRLRHGDIERGFAEADHIFEATFRTPSAQHVAMEPHAAVAHFEPDGSLVVYTGTQSPFNVRDALAEMFHLPREQVRLIVPMLGGSYGSKVFPQVEPIAAALAWKAGRPVKVVLTRDEEFVKINRHPATITVKVGVQADGTLLAKQVTAYWGTGAYADCGPGVAQKGGFGSVGPYRIPHVQVDSYCVYTNLPPSGAFRGYAVTQAAWASECMMDLVARELGLDPLEMRLKNLLHDGDEFATGEIMHDVHFEECLRTAAEAIGWPASGSPTAEVEEGPAVRGKGLAVILKGMTTPSRSEAAVELNADGQITLHTATIEMGQGARTVLAQVAGQVLGVPASDIRVSRPDTTITPFDNRTTSSRSTYMMGSAVHLASEDLRRQVCELAAELLEARPADLVLADGRVFVAGSPERGLTLAEVVQQSGEARLMGRGEFANQGGLDPDTGRGIASSHWHQGATGVEVEVDSETGVVRIVRCHAAVYAGRVVNRQTAELQTEGCIVMGTGSALFEEIVYESGQVINPNLSDYMIPSFLDLPASMDHTLMERPEAAAHGLGETALPPVPAAVGNAVADALGIRIYDLPITPEKVLRALRQPPEGRPPRS
ncbi:MAG: xanthine dehydrogenase subunit D, partial [Chloroflexi bacterium]